jgi:hypothetical protein
MVACGDRFYLIDASLVDTMEVEDRKVFSPVQYVAGSVLEP